MKLPILLLGSLMMAASGCAVYTRPIPAAATVSVDYDPLYYDGYVVYYDTIGRPYYYIDGRTHYVPRTYVGFNAYVNYYHAHRPAYNSWYAREGRRHVHTRRSPGYYHYPRGHHPVHRAPPPRHRHHH
ncbi:MAG: hypothetical protein HOW73_17685 [Polyangiaceae bacterium]|nr:hypothetical protein [Polyangiaceae bacterium]